MKIKLTLLALTVCLFAVAAAYASDTNVGSWKLNESKSKIPAGVSKNTSVVYTMAGDDLKAVVEGVDAKGNPTHNEWTGKFDGRDYPIVGDPSADTRAISKIDDHHFRLVNKKGGKPTVTGSIVTSADGKTRTLTTRSKGKDGKPVAATFVYDKE